MADQREGHHGLGFHAAVGPQDAAAGGDSGDGDAADALLKQYMAEALSYHEAHSHEHQQQQVNSYGTSNTNQSSQAQQHQSVPYAWHQQQYGQQIPSTSASTTHNVQQQQDTFIDVIPPPPTFVSGQTLPASFVSAPSSSGAVVSQPQSAQQHVQVLVPAREVLTRNEAPGGVASGIPSSSLPPPDSDSIGIQQQQQQQQIEHSKAIDDALALAMRVPPSSSTRAAPAPPPPPRRNIPATITIPTKSPAEYSAGRARHAEIEQKRLRAALLRNFEYVARRDEADMKRHMEELERQREVGKMMEERQKRGLEGRIAAATAAANGDSASRVGGTSKSGIGTKSRQKIERTKKKEGHVAIDGSRQRELRCAVYITGLPVGEGTISEDDVAALFGSYGTVKRTTLYVDRRTRRRKGDGLVVYDVPKLAGNGDVGSSGWKAAEDMVRSVCEQVSDTCVLCRNIVACVMQGPLLWRLIKRGHILFIYSLCMCRLYICDVCNDSVCL
mmetsp:Transcript_31797/g.68831  ORF Transcript_31797/g.68831 Transcript_31797/m.68831 type:complete len:500 (+) Transcript_31797:45-1544(+)